ncbi:MAG: hypothetical protein KW806_00080 [Candidatus Yanofskybacteria bacterium]|nr:hypothetical protein [Candidatus Yanofskybacteria bacterium]
MKHLSFLTLSFLVLSSIPASAYGEVPTIDATLNTNTPVAQTLQPNAQQVELARIDIYAAYGDMYLQGIQLGADTANGLQNFANIVLYNATNNAVLGEYPSTNMPNTVIRFSNIIIGYQQTKTFYIRGTLTSSAAGIVRVGFQDVILGNAEAVVRTHFPMYGNAMTLPGATPTLTITPSPRPSPTPTPLGTPIPAPLPSAQFKDGELVRIDGTNPVWLMKVINGKVFRRWIISPRVLAAYPHLAGQTIRVINKTDLDPVPVSSLIRLSGSPRVYQLSNIQEGVTATRQWIQTYNAFTRLGLDMDAVYIVNSLEFPVYRLGTLIQ